MAWVALVVLVQGLLQDLEVEEASRVSVESLDSPEAGR